LSNLLDDDVSLDFHIPFALNVDAASAHLASWLCDDDTQPTFSVVGVFSCSTNATLLQNALDTSLGKDLRLFVHLTTHLYTTGMQGGYQQYTDEEIQYVRDFVGNRLLLALDPLLRPSELEASDEKLSKLKSLFLLLLGTTVGMRYTCIDVSLFASTSSITHFYRLPKATNPKIRMITMAKRKMRFCVSYVIIVCTPIFHLFTLGSAERISRFALDSFRMQSSSNR
jgi:hypothetical protein